MIAGTVPRPRVHPEASAELRDAAIRYERQRVGLGDEFLTAVLDALATIGESPGRWPFVEGGDGARRYVMRRFPYVIVYLDDEPAELFHVIAIAHGGREPTYWRDRR